MLAFFRGVEAPDAAFGRVVASSLGLFAGVAPPAWRGDNRCAWQLPKVSDLPARAQRQKLEQRMACRPAQSPDGAIALVHGWIDNCAELARDLGCDPGDPASVYLHAVQRWGDAADVHIFGTYCAVVDDPRAGTLRLSRSTLIAPPLYYFRSAAGIGAASVPRALEAMGLPRRLNRRRLADSLYFNYADSESYLQGCFKVPYGSVVHVGREKSRTVTYYDPLAVKPLPRASRAEYVEEAERLLSEACRIYWRSARRPGLLLTGGLDSANVAARVLPLLNPGERLQTFTYVPLAGHGQDDVPGGLVDERPAVEAFAAMHPAIQPHFIDNRETEFDHRLEDMFLAMGTGTASTPAFFRYHGVNAAARAAGRDMLISADFGNFGFSSSGQWAAGEYLRTGKLRQLWHMLRRDPHSPGGLLWRLGSRAIVPSLPDPLWRAAMRLRGKRPVPINTRISGLREEALAEFDIEERAAEAGNRYVRPLYGWRRDLVRDNFTRGDVEGSDLIQGFEQLYEVSERDPTSYRPLIDFCLGLPTSMFMHDGVSRWLARELGRGTMPEAQRTMVGYGQHNSDWHMRLTPRRAEIRREIEGIKDDPVLASMIDTQELLDAIDDWPEAQSIEDDVFLPYGFRLPRVVAMARYVRFMTGRNPEA